MFNVRSLQSSKEGNEPNQSTSRAISVTNGTAADDFCAHMTRLSMKKTKKATPGKSSEV